MQIIYPYNRDRCFRVLRQLKRKIYNKVKAFVFCLTEEKSYLTPPDEIHKTVTLQNDACPASGRRVGVRVYEGKWISVTEPHCLSQQHLHYCQPRDLFFVCLTQGIIASVNTCIATAKCLGPPALFLRQGQIFPSPMFCTFLHVWPFSYVRRALSGPIQHSVMFSAFIRAS